MGDVSGPKPQMNDWDTVMVLKTKNKTEEGSRAREGDVFGSKPEMHDWNAAVVLKSEISDLERVRGKGGRCLWDQTPNTRLGGGGGVELVTGPRLGGSDEEM